LGLSAPILAIMVYFIGTLSAMLVRFQEQEIAMFISRGSSRVQMLILTLLEGLIVLLAAMPAGIAISMALARMLGYSLTFLRFVPREPLAVYLASLDWRLVGACAAVVIVARLIPGWTAARKSIVVQEQGSARTRLALGTARLLLIGGLVATTAYAYRQLNAIGTMSLVSWQPNEASHDPLLLLAPSLFLLASPLVACELFAWLVRPLGWLGSLLNSAGAFLGCTELSREGARYRTPIYMLVLCLSAGVFYASLAKSADAWLIERREYEVGADLSFIPYYATDAEMLGMTPQDVREAFGSTAQLPISDYEQSPGVVEAMPVGDYRASMTVGKRTQRLRLMAIDRVKFPRVAYYREDYAARPLGELMNRLGSQMNGVLLPESLARELQLSEGDPVRITVEFMEETEAAFDLVLVGTFRYFPTMFEAEASVAVANLSYLQFETSALFDHSIWMRLAPEAVADEVLADLEQRKRVSSYNVHELRELVERDQSRLERVGIFGMLSVCFLTGALLSALGLFVHSAASMRGRSLRFAVLQALGLPREKLMLGVALEYGVALLYSVLVGLSLGIASAQLYVPFFQLTDKREVPVPPYLPLVDQERAIWMAIAMGLALASVVVGVFVRLVRTKVFETLRLGTRL
ncbi:MAG: FtsX-like permease family protein, partial [Chloroflexi bacterium]|nr:FtsX-like permease family protein [Chloroflexota bacterium]